MSLCFGFDLHNVDVCSTPRILDGYLLVLVLGCCSGDVDVLSDTRRTFIGLWRLVLYGVLGNGVYVVVAV